MESIQLDGATSHNAAKTYFEFDGLGSLDITSS